MQSSGVGIEIIVIDLSVKSFPQSSAKSEEYKLEYAYVSLDTCAKFCSELQ